MNLSRNNWLVPHMNNHIKPLTYPNFCDNDLIRHVSFCNRVTFYHMEKESILKKGFQLTWKSLFPTSSEHQNVKLSFKIFDRTNVTALEVL